MQRYRKAVVWAVMGTALGSPVVWGAGQTPPSAPVTVVNPPSNPVPVSVQGGSVTGSVSITNTPNVNVTNTPTVEVVPAVATRHEISGAGNQAPGEGFGACLPSPVVASTIVVSSLNGAGQLEIFEECDVSAGLSLRVVVPANTAVVVPLNERIYTKRIRWTCIGTCSGNYSIVGQTAQ